MLTIREILLVGKDEQQAVLHLAVVDDPVQLLPRLVDARAVGRVDDEDEALGTCSRTRLATLFHHVLPDDPRILAMLQSTNQPNPQSRTLPTEDRTHR